VHVAFKILGGLLVLFGIVDFGGSYAGFDLWTSLGVSLPDIIWRFSAYIEIAAGYALMQVGNATAGADEGEAEQT